MAQDVDGGEQVVVQGRGFAVRFGGGSVRRSGTGTTASHPAAGTVCKGQHGVPEKLAGDRSKDVKTGGSFGMRGAEQGLRKHPRDTGSRAADHERVVTACVACARQAISTLPWSRPPVIR